MINNKGPILDYTEINRERDQNRHADEVRELKRRLFWLQIACGLFTLSFAINLVTTYVL